MPNKIPTLQNLKEFVSGLRANYIAKKNGKANPERLLAIEHLEYISNKLTSTNDNEILLGAILFFEASIKCRIRSDLLSLFGKGPHHSHDMPSDEQKLTCLHKFFDFANKNKIYLDFTAEHKEDIAEYNRQKLKPATTPLIKNLKSKLDELFVGARVLTIGDQIAKLPDEYKHKKDAQPATIKTAVSSVSLFGYKPLDYTKERLRHLAISRALAPEHFNAYAKKLLPPVCITKKHLCDADRQKQWEHYKYTIRCGYVLFLLKKISSQYPLTSATNSVLMQAALDLFGTTDINKIPKVHQKIYLSNFREFLNHVMAHDETLRVIEASGVFSKSTTAEKFVATMAADIDKNFTSMIGPYVTTGLLFVGGAAAQFAFGLQVAKLAKHIWDGGSVRGLLPYIVRQLAPFTGGIINPTVMDYLLLAYEETIMLTLLSWAISAASKKGVSYVTGVAIKNQEATRVQSFCTTLDGVISDAMKGKLQDHIKEELDWIRAAATFHPEEFGKLQENLMLASEDCIFSKETPKLVAPVASVPVSVPAASASAETAAPTAKEQEPKDEPSRFSMRMSSHY